MTNWLMIMLLIPALQGLLGCSADPTTGPEDVKWDRDACERCRMVLSDRHYAAQVRIFPEGSRSKVFYFDDIGCAALWLEDQPWREDPKTEIWVVDYRNDEWIDARTATYVTGRMTPMEYGLGAQIDAAPGGIDFDAAKRHVFNVEERIRAHGLLLQDRLKDLAEKPKGAPQAPKDRVVKPGGSRVNP